MSTDPQSQSATDPQSPRHFILGTAGHIDHGKTSLVRALTGIDTDRLPEEKRRGMTIELGFAALTIGSNQFGIVDVPGHERFVRTMVAGATGIDIALIVVAADDSVMPQTIEHVEILHLLGVQRGVVAITKVDTVDEEMVELVIDDVQRLLSGTPLQQAPIHPVSSITMAGIDELKQAIETVAQQVELHPPTNPFRLAVDRVFTVQGRGTVVTGSVLRGTVEAGDTLEIHPGGLSCRVRDLQAHGQKRGALTRGQRAAMNISGIDRKLIPRGAELTTPEYLTPSRLIDVRLDTLSSTQRPLKSTSIVRLEMGTTEHRVRVVLLGQQALEPGETSYAQLRCGESILSAYGQRFIIRNENATRTIGGGIVLRPNSRRRRRGLDEEVAALKKLDGGTKIDRVEQVLWQSGFGRPTDLHLCARSGVELKDIPELLDELQEQKRWVVIKGTDVFTVPAAIDDLSVNLTRWLRRFHEKHPELPGRPVDSVLGWLERLTSRSVARSLFDKFERGKAIKRLGRFVCLKEFAPALSSADEKIMATMIKEIRDGAFQPPLLDALSIAGQTDRKRRERLATLAVSLEELVRVEAKIYLHVETEELLRSKVAELIERDGGVTVAQVREALDSSRKYVVPFLEYLDRIGYTKRVEDRRVLA